MMQRGTLPVLLNVGGKRFATTRETLAGSVFFSRVSEADVPFVDRDPKHFQRVLNFLRDGDCPLPSTPIEVAELRAEAAFYGLAPLEARCVAAEGERENEPSVVLLRRVEAAITSVKGAILCLEKTLLTSSSRQGRI